MYSQYPWLVRGDPNAIKQPSSFHPDVYSTGEGGGVHLAIFIMATLANVLGMKAGCCE